MVIKLLIQRTDLRKHKIVEAMHTFMFRLTDTASAKHKKLTGFLCLKQ